MDLSKIKPTGKGIIIKPEGQASVTSSGLILPEDQNATTPVVGRILAVGPASGYNVGQLIFWRRYSIDEMKFDTPEGEQIVYMVEDDEVKAIYDNGTDS